MRKEMKTEGITEEHYWFVKDIVQNAVGIKDPNLVDDIVQEVFLRVLSKPRKIKNLRAYLFKATINTSKTFLKRKAKRTKKETDIESTTLKHPNATEEIVIKKEQMKIFKKALSKLPERDRKIFLMREYEGKSYGEISALTGEKTGTLRSIVSRARVKILNLIEGGDLDEL